jgi:hypothetical protein
MKVAIGGAILFCLGWLLWPYYALYDLSTAVNAADPVGIERRIDWESVRHGLQDDLRAALLQRLANDQQSASDAPGKALGAGITALMVPALTDRLFDTFANSSSIATLIRSGKLSRKPISTQTQAQTGEEDAAEPRPILERTEWAFFSGGPLTFRVDVGAYTPDVHQPLILAF